jgi:hypothetical protein
MQRRGQQVTVTQSRKEKKWNKMRSGKNEWAVKELHFFSLHLSTDYPGWAGQGKTWDLFRY